MESQEERDRIATTLRGLDALLGIEEEVIKEEAKKVGMVYLCCCHCDMTYR